MSTTNTDNIEMLVTIPFQLKKKYFSDIPFNLLSKLKMSSYSLMATSLPDHALYLIDVLKCYHEDLTKVVITDATSCIGGNSRIFVSVFKYVNIVDISKMHIDILNDNFDVLGLHTKYKNFITINENYLNIMEDLKQDIIFLDPPWGGPNYIKNNSKFLYLQDKEGKYVDINDLISNVLCKKAGIIVVKIPRTYDVKNFYSMNIFKSIKIARILKLDGELNYSMVLLSNIEPFKEFPESRKLSTVNYRKFMKDEEKRNRKTK